MHLDTNQLLGRLAFIATSEHVIRQRLPHTPIRLKISHRVDQASTADRKGQVGREERQLDHVEL